MAACTSVKSPESKPINYIRVESISDFLDKIVKSGGKITQTKQEVPEVGWIAAAEDPEGNAVCPNSTHYALVDDASCTCYGFAGVEAKVELMQDGVAFGANLALPFAGPSQHPYLLLPIHGLLWVHRLFEGGFDCWPV